MSRISEQLDPHFDGRTYEPEFDHARLTGQLMRVYEFMQDGRWHTISVIVLVAGGSEAAVSARLRDLRKPKFGSHLIDRRRVGTSGLFEYRLVK
jgi:predicted Holliday junction resolvase-like endonuclease